MPQEVITFTNGYKFVLGEALWDDVTGSYRIIKPCTNWLPESGLQRVTGASVGANTTSGFDMYLSCGQPWYETYLVEYGLEYDSKLLLTVHGIYDKGKVSLSRKTTTMVFGIFVARNENGDKIVNIPGWSPHGVFIPEYNVVGEHYFASGAIPYADFKKYLGDDIQPVPEFPGPDNEKDPPGGDGDGELEDDPIEIPGDPSLSAANAGLLTLYTPTLSQIHNLGSYLWSDSFSLDTFKKLFSDPMEAIIGLSVVPVSVPTSGAQNIVIGVTDSGVSANRAASQYVTVDCGTISVKPIWNTALDFEPYTKFSIFLPFIGTREISTDDIMGKDVNIKYLVDVFSGACTAHIKVGGSVLYQFSGSCTTPIPISALSWSNLVTSSIGLLAGGTAAAAAGGVAGGVALAAMTAGAVARSKPTIQRAGNVSGAAGMLGVRVPYLIRETPRQSLAKDYNKFVGYPSNITSKLDDLKGYTQIENVHLEGIPATGDELSEIESLLKEGVIL